MGGELRGEGGAPLDAASAQHVHDVVGARPRCALVRGDLPDAHRMEARELVGGTVVPQLVLVDHAPARRLEAAVRSGERPAQRQRVRIDAVLVQQTTDHAAGTLRLLDGVADDGRPGGVRVAPRGVYRVVADPSALHLDDDDAALGVDQQEVDLRLIGAALLPHRDRDLGEYEDPVIELVDRPTPERLLRFRCLRRPARLGRYRGPHLVPQIAMMKS